MDILFGFQPSTVKKEKVDKTPFTFIATNGEAKVALTKVGTPNQNSFLYCINNDTDHWTTVNFGSYITLNQNDTVSFKGLSSQFSLDNANFYRFQTSGGNLNLCGNINSLTNFKDGGCFIRMLSASNQVVDASQLKLSQKPIPPSGYAQMFGKCPNLTTPPSILPAKEVREFSYRQMFSGCTSLTSAPELPATTLADNCYRHMFQGCSSLLLAPSILPATVLTLSCYTSMFYNCSSLSNAPQLPATTLASSCYAYMFWNCFSLSSAPQILPATTLCGSCYWNMFAHCTSLTSAPSLPATIVADECYRYMFYGCTSLSSAPSILPATTLAPSCYYGMFSGCASLTSTPQLPATTLATECYIYMFQYCSSLIQLPPSLPATELAEYCCISMFRGCYALTSIPQNFLPATTLVRACYKGMFSRCSSLLIVPQNLLPATTLAENCYENMFQGCTNLTSAPYLPATTLTEKCYVQMFNGCTNLSSIEVGFEDWTDTSTTSATYNWVLNVAPTGVFTKKEALSAIYGNNNIPTNWRVQNVVPLTFTGVATLGQICLEKIGNPNDIELKYSKNGGQWTDYTIGTQLDLNINETISFSGASTNTYFKNLDNRYHFSLTGIIDAGGSIQSLVDYKKDVPTWGYNRMFSGCTALRSAPQLPATKLEPWCYCGLFYKCTRLTGAPQLPATELSNGCYNAMFADCTSLSSVPSILPATELVEQSYYVMFSGCNKLTDAPQIAATTLAPSSCQEMFRNCTSLSSISVKFTDWDESENATLNWVTSVASAGEFTKPIDLTAVYNNSHIPTDWRIKVADQPLTFTAKSAGTAIALSSIGSPDAITLQYNRNNTGWQDYTLGDILEIGNNDTVMFSGANDRFSKDYNNRYGFAMTGTIEADGNIQSLMNFSDSVTSSCYRSLFAGCTAMTKAPQLPVERLDVSCYDLMFQNCTSLTDAPQLPATELATDCYGGMFKNCTSLTSIPNLPATTLATACYISMFQGCTSLVTLPQFYTVTLADECYEYMFAGCSSLTQAPSILPTKTLVNGCYYGMFSGCTNLTEAPQLPATTLTYACYQNMFKNCTSLSSINVGFTTEWSNNYTSDWVRNVAPTGIFTKPEALSTVYGVSRIPTNWSVKSINPLSFTGKDTTNVIRLTKMGNPTDVNISYKKGDSNWAAYNITDAITLSANQTVMFSGANNKFSEDVDNYYQFIMVGTIEANGNIQSLMNYSDSAKPYCYYNLFNGCTSLTDAPKLSATGLADACYTFMFRGCTSLTTPPQLPATGLAQHCYGSMFSGCTSLTAVPALPAKYISYHSYDNMFNSCSSLSTVPSDLIASVTGTHHYGCVAMFAGCTSLTCTPIFPNTSLGQFVYGWMFDGCTSLLSAADLPNASLNQGCYRNMFEGCTSLTSAPVLSATTLANGCYQNMFTNCTSLTSAPQLPAMTAAQYCYREMFKGCSSLLSAPQLPATTTNHTCYWEMFMNCSSLSSAPQILPATTLADNCYRGMFSNCTSLPTTPSLPATGLAPGCYQSMFAHCTSLTSAPSALPATELVNNCYNSMFDTCTSLITAPQLPATTLVDRCYRAMFVNCSNLSSISVAFTDWTQATEATLMWVKGVAASGIFTKPDELSAEYGQDRIPTNWRVEEVVENIPLTFTAKSASNAVALTQIGTPSAIELNYSKNDGEWAAYTIGDIISLDQNDTVAFSGNNDHFSKDSNNYYRFAMTGTFEADGNIQSLMDYSDSVTSSCYMYMFAGGGGTLIKAPQLPATTLAPSCYAYMYFYCTALTSAPILSATTLANNCYYQMFYGCISLIKAPQLLATTLAPSCCYSMFGNCSSLSTAPQLPATTLANQCYNGMFWGCSSLLSAPALPASTLADYCYYQMFRGCSNLSSAPQILPATTLTQECYAYMFYACSSLLDAPYLPATTLYGYCYYYMFENCTNLSSISVALTGWNSLNSHCNGWVFNVAPTGIFYKPSILSTIYSINHIPSGWRVEEVVEDIPLTFTAKSATNSIRLSSIGTPSAIELNYSKNNGEWAAYTIGDVIELNQNQTVMFSGANDHFSNDYNSCYQFQMTGTIEGAGNIQSLMNFSNTLSGRCYDRMFEDCSSLITAPQLPATALADYCYQNMFYGCTSLTAAPQLPATTLASDCYEGMFVACIALKTPPVLPATTLADRCYQYMFQYCFALTAAPQLPATTLSSYCYRNMFQNCTSLSSAPQLPASTLVSNCYYEMFRGCSKLSSISVEFTNWTQATDATTNWVQGVAANGEFAKPDELSTEYGNSRIPTNWTVNGEEEPVIDPLTVPLTFTASGNATIAIEKVKSPTQITLKYSKNGGEWTTYTPAASGSTVKINLADGDTIAFSGAANNFSEDASNYYRFMMTGYIAASGNVQSLRNFDNDNAPSYCFRNLFDHCSGLMSAPLVPATTLNTACYRGMFGNCSVLVVPPELPATTLAADCYFYMFDNDVGLLDAPYLPATTLKSNCYNRMFQNCTNLSSISVALTSWTGGTNPTLNWVNGVAPTGIFTKPDILPISTGINNIPVGWTVQTPQEIPTNPLTFTGKSASNAIKLTKTGSPNAITLSYKKNNGQWTAYTLNDVIELSTNQTVMFSGANDHFSKNLTNYYQFQMTGTIEADGNIQSLMNYSDSVTSSCYYRMFSGCTSLTKAPQLPATTLADECYQSMFWGCTSLTSAPSLPATTLANDCYAFMFSNCSNLSSAPYLPATTLANTCYYCMFKGCTNLSSISVAFTAWPGARLSATKNWVSGVAANGEFTCPEALGTNQTITRGASNCPTNWNVVNPPTPLTFKGKSATNAIKLTKYGSPSAINLSYSKNHGTWAAYSLNTVINLNQNQTVMFSGANTSFSKDLENYYRFYMTGSIEADGNIQSLMNYSDSCTSGCYTYMFRDCTSLTKAPQLPATGLVERCYYRMFWGCTSLTSAPQLPATTLANSCYVSMFQGCTNLSSAPQLPATTLTSYCYANMFAGCSNLTAAPQLPATTLTYSCYNSMFAYCTNLSSAPELPATTLANYCYYQMFSNCSNLSSAPQLPATGLAEQCYRSMFASCKSLTSAPQLPATTLAVVCYFRMFQNCTNLSNAPQLPATELANSCYQAMFQGCTNLSSAPQLPATTLASQCYQAMFKNCTNLSSISVAFTDWTQANTRNWVSGVAANGTFTKPANLPLSTGIDYIPTNWTVINK